MKNKTILLALLFLISFCTFSITAYTQSACPILGTATFCAATTVAITTSGSSSGSETWSSSNTAIATVISTGAGTATVYGVSAGTAIITYNSGGSPVAICPFPITVETTVSPTVSSSTTTICSGGLPLLLSPNPPGGSWSSSNTAIASVNASSGAVSGLAGGTFTITYTYTNSCGSFPAAPYAMTVDPDPGAITGPAAVCAGSTITLSDPTGHSGGGWLSGNTAVASVNSSSGVVTGEGAGTAIISYSAPTECPGVSAIATTTVEVDVPITATVTGTQAICAGSTTTLAGSPSGGTWSSSRTAIATVDGTAGIVTGVTAGTANITYTITNSCGVYSSYQTVTVNVLPDADMSGPNAVCAGGTMSLTDATTGGTWTSGNTAIGTIGSSSGIIYGVSAGLFQITYTVTGGDGCTVTEWDTREVDEPLTVSSITGTASVCEGASTALADAMTGGSWSSTATTIATTDVSGAVYGAAAGTATISYSITNACGTYAATQVVTVHPVPDAGTLSGSPLIFCYSSGAVLTSSGTSGGTWASSTTTVATVIASADPGVALVYGVAAGTTTITYTVTSIYGCGSPSTATRTVTVDGTPSAGTITGTATVCVGASTALADATTGGTWSSSSAWVATVSSAGAVYGVSGAATATITYTFTNACGNAHTTQVVTVNPLPNAGTISGCTDVPVGYSTAFTSSGDAGGSWSSSATAIATVDGAGNVWGAATGTATITYTVTNGCGSASATYAVTVDALPVISGPNNMCTAGNVETGGIYIILDVTVAGGSWSSSNTAVASAVSYAVYSGVPGTTTISYICTIGCTSVTATYGVTVNPVPYCDVVSGSATSLAVLSYGTYSYGASDPGGIWVLQNPDLGFEYPSTQYSEPVNVEALIGGYYTAIYYLVTNAYGCQETTDAFYITTY